jgi:hypothetical protein
MIEKNEPLARVDRALRRAQLQSLGAGPEAGTQQQPEPVDLEMWIALNRVKGGALIYNVANDWYMATASLSKMVPKLVGALAAAGYITQSGPGVYRMSAKGLQAWEAFPTTSVRGANVEGMCDICHEVTDLHAVYERATERYMFLCADCHEWERM